jgi:hypothetical protein
MRITTFFSDNLSVDRDGLAKDRRGGSGGAFGGHQGRQNGQDDSKRRSDADESSSIASLLGQALGQYHGSSAFEYSL